MLLLLLVAGGVSCCSPGTPFYPKEWPKWIEDSLASATTSAPTTSAATATTDLPTTATTEEEGILPTPEPPVDSTTFPILPPSTSALSWKQISVQQQNNYRPGADSFSEIYRRMEQQNLQHLVAVEPEGARPPWV